MGQILVRNIDDDLKKRLKNRASRNGVSMEEEARLILREALGPVAGEQFGLGSRIAALFRDIKGEEEPLPVLQTTNWKPISFDE